MKRKSVQSSNIISVGYDGDTLEIEFKGGSVYQYEDVPVELVLNLMLADSLGSFFHRFIKEHFHFSKLEPISGEEGSDG